MPNKPARPSRHMRTLRRRADWLSSLITMEPGRANSRDQAERAALEWALGELAEKHGPSGQKGNK